MRISEDIRRNSVLLRVDQEELPRIAQRVAEGDTAFRFSAEVNFNPSYIELVLDSPAFQAGSPLLIAKAFQVFPKSEEFDRPEHVRIFMLMLHMETGLGEATYVPTDMRLAKAAYSQFIGNPAAIL